VCSSDLKQIPSSLLHTKEPSPYIKTTITFPPAYKDLSNDTKEPPSSHKLQEYAGTYQLEATRMHIVLQEDGTLGTHIPTDPEDSDGFPPYVVLHHVENDTFRIKEFGATVTFQRTEQGFISGFTLTINGTVLTAISIADSAA